MSHQEIDFTKLNLKIPHFVKNYPIDLQREIYGYLSGLDDINRQAYEIAYDHLGTSFNIERSNGFKNWLSVLEFLKQLNNEDKLKFNYNNDYLFDFNFISESNEYKNWLKTLKS